MLIFDIDGTLTQGYGDVPEKRNRSLQKLGLERFGGPLADREPIKNGWFAYLNKQKPPFIFASKQAH